MDKFNEMQVFARVVEDGGFTAAAEALSLTTSGVSKIIARLEDRLGVLLLKRNSRTMSLTPEGQAYYERVLGVLEAIDQAEACVADPAREMSGVLRIHTPLSFACHQLAPLMPRFHELHPDLRVEFHAGTGPLRGLDSSIDLALYPWEMQDSSLVTRRIAEVRWVICAAPAYLARHGRPERPSELEQHACLNFAMDAACNTWRVWDKAQGKAARIAVKAVAGATESEILLALARQGLGIARLPEYQIARDVAAGRLVPLFPDDETLSRESIYAVYHSRRHLSPRVRVFLAYLEEALQQQRVPGTTAVAGALENPGLAADSVPATRPN